MNQADSNRLMFHIYPDKGNQWRWRLIAGNGKIIADSGESYHNREDCLSGIELVKRCESAGLIEVNQPAQKF